MEVKEKKSPPIWFQELAQSGEGGTELLDIR